MTEVRSISVWAPVSISDKGLQVGGGPPSPATGKMFLVSQAGDPDDFPLSGGC